MEENENVTEEVTQETQDTQEKQEVEKPVVDESKFESAGDDSIIKVDLSKPVEDENQEETTEAADGTVDDTRVVGSDENSEPVQEQEKVQPEVEAQDAVLEEVTEEVTEEVEAVVEEVEEAIAEAQETGEPLPENIQKLIDFMGETGGTLEDYVNLNKDYSELDNMTALTEYYKRTKPHLDADEIEFLIEDSFNYDEELDEERDIRRKKLALKEQVASAKAYLDGQKSKYYEEVKAGSRLTPEAQKAMNFFNRYNKESEQNEKVASEAKLKFNQKTDQVFNDKFKGFEYNVGDKKYRFNVKNAKEVKNTQSDINNFVKKFLAEDNTMSDAKGYHKSLFTAMNADAIAQHFYEQGKADAVKDSVNKAKNVNMDPRQTHNTFEGGGMKVRVLGENSSDFKFKIKKR
tara:strand:+ start:3709 stop:4920 length:1212 start_codon:yes stop_codon:yes gene_type:complete